MEASKGPRAPLVEALERLRSAPNPWFLAGSERSAPCNRATHLSHYQKQSDHDSSSDSDLHACCYRLICLQENSEILPIAFPVLSVSSKLPVIVLVPPLGPSTSELLTFGLLLAITCPFMLPLPLSEICSPAKLTPVNAIAAEKSPETLMSSTANINASIWTNGGSNGVGRFVRFADMFGLPTMSIEPVARIVTWSGLPLDPMFPVSFTFPPFGVLGPEAVKVGGLPML